LAIAAGFASLVESITAANTLTIETNAAKLAKDLEVSETLLGLLTAFAGITALESPEAVAAILAPIIDVYFSAGQSITKAEGY